MFILSAIVVQVFVFSSFAQPTLTPSQGVGKSVGGCDQDLPTLKAAFDSLVGEVQSTQGIQLEIQNEVWAHNKQHLHFDEAFWKGPLPSAQKLDEPFKSRSKEWYINQVNNRFIALYKLAEAYPSDLRPAKMDEIHKLFQASTMRTVLFFQNFSLLQDKNPKKKIDLGQYASKSSTALTLYLEQYEPSETDHSAPPRFFLKNIKTADLGRLAEATPLPSEKSADYKKLETKAWAQHADEFTQFVQREAAGKGKSIWEKPVLAANGCLKSPVAEKTGSKPAQKTSTAI